MGAMMQARQQQPEYMVYAPNAWHGQWMNRQQLFSRIGKTAHVVYSSGPWMLYHRSDSRYWKAPLMGKDDVADNVTISTSPLLLPLKANCDSSPCRIINRFYNKHINRKFSFPDNKILYIFHPEFSFLRHIISHKLCVYHAYDDFSRQDGYDEKLAAYEKDLVVNADIVYASSRAITDKLRALNDRVSFLPNGVDYNSFSNDALACPDDLRPIPGPRIGYTGAINQKVNLKLIAELASANPALSFIFIGGISNLDETGKNQLETLHALGNVHFLGQKSHLELPAYMNHMDINIMCYNIEGDIWARNGYPLKMHEYLATGKPVISADLAAVRDFSDVITIADDTADWNSKILHALKQEQTSELVQMRRDVARNNDWDNRASVISRDIENWLSAST